jgi:predicted nucleotide-binding protein
MEVDKAVALITAAGIELTDRRRTPNDNGWHLSFSNGAVLDVYDSGRTANSGKGVDALRRALGLPPTAAQAAKASKASKAKTAKAKPRH